MFKKLLNHLENDSQIKHKIYMDDYFENDLNAKCICGCNKKLKEFKEGELFNIV